MGMFDLIRTVLGLGGSEGSEGPEPTDATATHDSEGRNDVESAETDGSGAESIDVDDEPADVEDAVAAGTDAAASTDSMVEMPTSDPETAAEPAEAGAGVTEHSGTDTPAAEPAEAAGPVPDGADASGESGGTDGMPETGDTGGSEESDDTAGDPVETINGIGPAYSERLANANVETVPELLDADAGELAEATGISEKRINGWRERAAE